MAKTKMCVPCTYFFQNWKHNPAGECDCPKCQGFCKCEHPKSNPVISADKTVAKATLDLRSKAEVTANILRLLDV